jgi:hypothetical protein
MYYSEFKNHPVNMFKSILVKTVFFVMAVLCFTACEKDTLLPYYPTQEKGKMVIMSYAADSINIVANAQLLSFDDKDIFIKDINEIYEFVSFDNQDEVLGIKDYHTGETVHTYRYANAAPLDTISFFYKKDYFIDDVLSFRKGTLSQAGYVGFKFIFPNMGQYSGSSYEGTLDAIIRNLNGQVLAIAENINKNKFSTFAEYPFKSPPVIKVELVKHGTNESYIEGKQIIIEMVMQNNKSKMIVLEETKNESNAFSGVRGSIDLTQYFDFQQK